MTMTANTILNRVIEEVVDDDPAKIIKLFLMIYIHDLQGALFLFATDDF